MTSSRWRITSTALGTAMAIAMSFGSARAVVAECDGPFPDFRELVKTAKTIVIGDVVAIGRGGAWDPIDEGVSSRFTLEIAYVVRGSSGAVVQLDDMPTTQCASVIGARLGDRIALAVDGSAFDRAGGVNMVAWIDAVPPPGFGPGSAVPASTFTVEEVFGLIGQGVPASPTPDAALAEVPAPDPLPQVALLVVAIAAALAIVVRRRRAAR